MSALLISLLLLVQGIPVQPTQSGTITGVLRNGDGKPAPGVRVAAIPQTQFATDGVDAATLSSIAETDEQGRYSLENIPPGRYYIAAGRLDLQTYYPGTQAMNAALPVRIEPGAKVQGIDFVLAATSAGRAVTANFSLNPGFIVPLRVAIEGGGKLPASGNGKPTTVSLTSTAGTYFAKPTDGSLSLPPGSADYRITVEGLPTGYSVKSMAYGATPITDNVLKMTTAAPVNAGNLLTFVPSAPSQAQVLSIVLNYTAPATRRTGATIRGTLPVNSTLRVLYLSGVPGAVFTDGTFEFRDVPPGRHVIMTADNPPSTAGLGAAIIVGTSDVDNVEVVSMAVIPSNVRTLTVAGPAGSRTPGPIPLASLHGQILDLETGKPVTAGTVFVVGDTWAKFDLTTAGEGRFEFLKLLPGNYELEVQGVGYPTFRRPIVVEEQDVDLELKAG